VQLVLHICMSPEWHAIWTELAVRVESFASLGLPVNTPDAALWQFCQTQQIILITGNRNEDAPESLEAVLQTSNTRRVYRYSPLVNPNVCSAVGPMLSASSNA
jgi:hypothetical protein